MRDLSTNIPQEAEKTFLKKFALLLAQLFPPLGGGVGSRNLKPFGPADEDDRRHHALLIRNLNFRS